MENIWEYKVDNNGNIANLVHFVKNSNIMYSLLAVVGFLFLL